MEILNNISSCFHSNDFTLLNLLTMFYFFAIAGWIWESTFCSIKEKHLINRGMLMGPYIPIYGFGGLYIYIIFNSVEDTNIIKIFIIGMVSASILEYFTSLILEKIFQVKLWNYEGQFLNINGRICLGASIFWGILSVIFTKFINPIISKELFSWNHDLRLIIITSLTTLFIMDFISTVTSVLGLKQKIANIKKFEALKLDELKQKIDVIIENKDDYKKIIAEYKNKMYLTNNIFMKHFYKSYKNMRFLSKENQNIFNKLKNFKSKKEN